MIERKFDEVPIDYDTEEDWSYEGMKVYNFRYLFNDNLDYIEEFVTEDHQLWSGIMPMAEWTEEVRELAKKDGII